MSYATPTPARGLQAQVAPGEPFGLRKHIARTRGLKDGETKKPVIGSWLMLPGSNLARMTAAAGYDFILVDCEHGNIDDAMMHEQVAAIGAVSGCSPIVRIAAPEIHLVKRALDTGAHGLLCPMMSTAAEARNFVSMATFPQPRASRPTAESIAASPYSHLVGQRGAGSPFAPAVFGQTLGTYLATANDNVVLAVQIESEEGLANCEEIAKVDGIDMLFVGPNDLCNSMGFPAVEHPNIPEVQEAIHRVLAAAHAAGKTAGMFCTSSDQVRYWTGKGFDLMNLGFDAMALADWNAKSLKAIEDLR